jgi:hypothetical protein
VRAAALAAFARVAPDRAEPVLDQQLGAAASAQSIDAASALLSLRPARAQARAQAALTAALSSAEPTLRAQAAAALQRLPAAELDRSRLQSRLRDEKVASVRLALALVLGAKDPASRRALTDLSQVWSLTGAEAAAELAAHSGEARTRLCSFSTHDAALVRMTAARLMSRVLRDPQPISKLLADASWQVREAAAGAVLNVL